MKIAIQGHPIRGKEIIRILESLGATSYRVYDKCSNPEWYWLIDKNKEIVCYPKKSIWGYKLYTLEEFEKEFPFKIGDKVITTDGTIGIIDKLKPGEDYPYCIKADVGGFYWCTISVLKSYKEMKEERNITLTLDKAKEWYKKGGELKEVALQAYSEKELTKAELPKSWEEFCKNYSIKPGETFVDGYSKFVVNNLGTRNPIYDQNICPSQKSAEAHLAMIQLEQLRDCWRQGWKPEWNNDQQVKYCIIHSKEFKIHTLYTTRRFLSFPTIEMAEEFLKCFRDLIEKAGDLI